MLVAYSDSEGSDNEEAQKITEKSSNKAVPKYSVDKSNPGTIKVNLQRAVEPTTQSSTDEPAAKRPRTGPGAFSGFNSILPAPKRDGVATNLAESKPNVPRKIFSLKTGAEASFSRDSDFELRNSSVDDGVNTDGSTSAQAKALPKPTFAKPAAPAPSGTPFMFKPLSVSRTGKKKKKALNTFMPQQSTAQTNNVLEVGKLAPSEVPVKKKISLFSSGSNEVPTIPEPDLQPHTEEEEDDLDQFHNQEAYSHQQSVQMGSNGREQSLDSIASDLNLTAAQRRQLFGRSGQPRGSAVNVVNFNTDEEYAANQALIAAGETVQHNPVRAIAPGKHSLRQLVNAAAGQKEALEESFAEGKRNKKEAGNKYGW